jgi:hypothetical protein
MGRTAAVLALVMAGCGGPAQQVPRDLDAGAPGPVDAGPADAGLTLPTPVTFTTERGTTHSAEAFPVISAQTLLQANDGGPPAYLGFQVADSAQCVNTNVDGGMQRAAPPVSHLLSGFVRNFDGTPVAAGTYDVGITDARQTYVLLVELDRASGAMRSLLATAGSVTVADYDAGHLEVSLDVTLGDPATQLELPFDGNFSADVCGP